MFEPMAVAQLPWKKLNETCKPLIPSAWEAAPLFCGKRLNPDHVHHAQEAMSARRRLPAEASPALP